MPVTEWLPPMPTWQTIQERLEVIFPDGMTNRNWFTRDIAAKTIFVMLYIDAVDGTGVRIRPDQVTRMTDAQARQTDAAARRAWRLASMSRDSNDRAGAWFAANSREPIRDETLRESLLPVGAVTGRTDLPTTSSKPRWALQRAFAELFVCDDEAFPGAAEGWRRANLSPAALARTSLAQGAVTAGTAMDGVLVRFPNGETRRMSAGPSSIISKAVIEVFAAEFLADAGVLWLSESANKVVARDDALARRVGFHIDQQVALPDIILVDLKADPVPLFVFVEVVASDGPITESRKRTFLELVAKSGHSPAHAAFVTAFRDRGSPEFRRCISALGVNTCAWCMSEPMVLIGVAAKGKRLTHVTALVQVDDQTASAEVE